MEIQDVIFDVIVGKAPHIVSEDVDTTSLLRDDLGINSLLLVDVTLELESKLGIEFDDEDLISANLNSVQDLIDLVQTYEKAV